MKKIIRHKGEAVMTKRIRIGDKGAEELVSEERKPVHGLPEFPAHVQVTSGLTRNLGQYESAKIGITITVPCDPGEKSLRDTYKKVSALVEELLELEYDKVIGE